MTTSRDHILGKVKANLGTVDHTLARARLKDPQGFRPTTTPAPTDDLADIFFGNVAKGYGTIERVPTIKEVPKAITSYLESKELDPTVVVPNTPEVEGLDYAEQDHRQIRSGDKVALTGCFLGVAETGTLIAHSSAELDISSLYLADHHIVLVRADQLVPGLEDIWPHFRGLAQRSNQGLPRSINWITGPSMSADIEKKLTLGIHGPISLHIILIG